MTAIGIRISGLAQARARLAGIEHTIGAWAAAQVGVAATEPYSYWIEHGRYYSGRPGRTQAYHYLQQAQRDLVPMMRGAVLESLGGGGPGASATAQALSERGAALARAYAPSVTDRLRRGIVPLRGGKVFRV